ncbi:hypothetical protein KF946_00955 [Idiomarina loihiensis]|uniref:hypothetical protein n=1 Tax=Idiomarina loihiensis TaxID=135577 RepID=UPI00129C6EC4|nr:hypothetical protein [Idiomarina loihiensis]MRJ44857.1 hypothetical protein [Idiomarina loihiensis]UTW33188.1 hypothetical protein KF946_00955 [Idiomarina loihiensis]
MTPDQQLIILKLQIAASILMGLDYFMPESWREKANEKAKAYFSGVQSRIDSDITSAWEYIKSKVAKIITAVVMLGLAFLMLYFKSLPIIVESPVFLSLWSIAPLLLFTGGFLTLFSIFMDILLPVGLGGLFRALTTFILGSPKGPLAAIGFICLCLSFFLRYNYIGNV